MDSRRALLIEMKRKAGLATPEECAEYDNAIIIIGEGLAVRRPAQDSDAFEARYGGLRHEMIVSEQELAMHDKTVDAAADTSDAHRTPARFPNDGLTQCAPGQEPSVPGCPNYNPNAKPKLSLRERYVAQVRGNSFRRG